MLTGAKKGKLEPIDIKYHRFRGLGNAFSIISKFDRDKEVLVYFDPDIDGLISGYFVCKFLTEHGFKFTWYINKNREHGFKLPIRKLRDLNIIAVDFLITFKELRSIVDAGNNIISMDHHVNEDGDRRWVCEDKGTEGVIINNQYPFEEEDGRYLSGAGVVFECLRLFDKKFDTKENRALVGLTLLSDVRDIENINARGYLIDLYTHKYRGYIGYLLDNTMGEVDYGFGVPRLDRNYVDFMFSPLINACLRFNQEEMVVNFILGSGRIDKSYLQRQRELVPSLVERSIKVEYDGLYIVKLDYDSLIGDEVDIASNFIGLVASRSLDDSHSCICYMTDENKAVKRASFRGHINGVDYRVRLNEGKEIEGVGHDSAFGIVRIEPSDALFRRLAKKCVLADDEWNTHQKKEDKKVIYVNNLSLFTGTKGYNIGLENIFCLSQNRVYVKYTGDNIMTKRSGMKYKEYSIDGVSVMCFDSTLDPKEDLILPVLEREVLNLYLNKKDMSDSGDFYFED